MSHFLGAVLKYLGALAVLIFSISLSYSFFSAIAPADMPWFVWAAMGLTEFGLLCWLGVFMLQAHQSAHKTLAFVMIFVCLAAVTYTDAMELARLFKFTLFASSVYDYALIVLLIAHFFALVVDFFISYFSKYSFHGDGVRAPLKNAAYEDGYQAQSQSLAQTATIIPQGPGLATKLAASAVNFKDEVKEIAAEKRAARHQRKQAATTVIPAEEEAKNE